MGVPVLSMDYSELAIIVHVFSYFSVFNVSDESASLFHHSTILNQNNNATLLDTHGFYWISLNKRL